MEADDLFRFEYRLAAHLGYANPERMLGEMTSRQYTGWLAYYVIEPFGAIQDDYRAGLIATVACRAAGDKKTEPSTLFPSLAAQDKANSVEAMAAMAKQFATSHNRSKRGRNTTKP